MGIWYTLKNGKEVQIDIRKDSENYGPDKLVIKLFGGSTTFEYPVDRIINLNEVLEEIEKNYTKYEQEDREFEYSCWCD